MRKFCLSQFFEGAAKVPTIFALSIFEIDKTSIWQVLLKKFSPTGRLITLINSFGDGKQEGDTLSEKGEWNHEVVYHISLMMSYFEPPFRMRQVMTIFGHIKSLNMHHIFRFLSTPSPSWSSYNIIFFV